jgi:beta-lactamase class A
MKLYAAAIAVSLSLARIGAVCAEPLPQFLPEWPVLLQSEVIRLTKTYDGEAMIYVKDLQTGARYSHNGSTPTYIASGVKIPFMLALFRLIADGRASLDEEMRYEASDVRDGAPVFNYLKVGTTIPIRVVLEAMIHQSDNAAADMIARRVGVENVNRTLVEEGIQGFGPITSLLEVRRLVYRALDPRVDQLAPQDFRSIGLGRTLEDRVLRLTEVLGEIPGTYTVPDVERSYKDYYRSGYNSASMESFGQLLELLATGKLISPEASQAMIEVLLGTLTGARRIPSKLPPGTPVAHKTGTQHERICDFGIIYVAAERPVVMAACTKGSNKARSEEVIASTARKLYELLAPDPALVSRGVGTSTTGPAVRVTDPGAAPSKLTKKKPPARKQNGRRAEAKPVMGEGP